MDFALTPPANSLHMSTPTHPHRQMPARQNPPASAHVLPRKQRYSFRKSQSSIVRSNAPLHFQPLASAPYPDAPTPPVSAATGFFPTSFHSHFASSGSGPDPPASADLPAASAGSADSAAGAAAHMDVAAAIADFDRSTTPVPSFPPLSRSTTPTAAPPLNVARSLMDCLTQPTQPGSGTPLINNITRAPSPPPSFQPAHGSTTPLSRFQLSRTRPSSNGRFPPRPSFTPDQSAIFINTTNLPSISSPTSRSPADCSPADRSPVAAARGLNVETTAATPSSSRSAFPPAPLSMAKLSTITSPLKRHEGSTFDEAASGSPIAKRRQLQLNSFAPTSLSPTKPRRNTARVSPASLQFLFNKDETSPFVPSNRFDASTGPIRPGNRPFSLRKSAASSRASASRIFTNALPSSDSLRQAPATATESDRSFLFNPQMSSRLPLGSDDHSVRRDTDNQTMNGYADLDNSPAKGVRGMMDDLPKSAFHDPCRREHLSKSLPIGTRRPPFPKRPFAAQTISTPAALNRKPIFQLNDTTGLVSKCNAPIPDFRASTTSVMPDTPSKRSSFSSAPIGDLFNTSRTGRRPTFGAIDFDAPDTPNPNPPRRTALFDNDNSLFGPTRANRSFSLSHRPGPNYDLDLKADGLFGNEGQSSNDELPPTPTKPFSSSVGHPRKPKATSLRSNMFTRRTLENDTFVPPDPPAHTHTSFSFLDNDHSSAQSPSPVHPRFSTPVGGVSSNSAGKGSPHTPQGHPSQSVNGNHFSESSNLAVAVESGRGLTPATPTAQRDSPSVMGVAGGILESSVDPSITSRFRTVSLEAAGEFSFVFKVSGPCDSQSSSRLVSQLARSSSGRRSRTDTWAVKKAKRPYLGNRDRNTKLREVEILRALEGGSHIIEFFDSWEDGGHLYIQTEYCKNGNLKDFLLTVGSKGRLDDFRIWKVAIDIAQGIKFIHDSNYIHLDLKPANVFIDDNGALKIGDFGLASAWPAPNTIDGEGDRTYIGPEVLNGHYDKPADVFAFGMIILEIAANTFLPDNGSQWQRLRAGDFSDVPCLTSLEDGSKHRDAEGNYVEQELPVGLSMYNAVPPEFMAEPSHPYSLDNFVRWLICPDPDVRPTIDKVCQNTSLQWVYRKKRSPTTVFEGAWGPSEEDGSDDVDMTDIN